MDYSKYSNHDIAVQLAAITRVVNETREMLELYEQNKQSIQFEFLMRFDKKFRKEHSFLLPPTTGTVKETIDD